VPVDRERTSTSLIDVLDRVLDKGIVIEAWVRVSLAGINLQTIEARMVVASIETYLTYSGPLQLSGLSIERSVDIPANERATDR
jgi:hypothetical protein